MPGAASRSTSRSKRATQDRLDSPRESSLEKRVTALETAGAQQLDLEQETQYALEHLRDELEGTRARSEAADKARDAEVGALRADMGALLSTLAALRNDIASTARERAQERATAAAERDRLNGSLADARDEAARARELAAEALELAGSARIHVRDSDTKHAVELIRPDAAVHAASAATAEASRAAEEARAAAVLAAGAVRALEARLGATEAAAAAIAADGALVRAETAARLSTAEAGAAQLREVALLLTETTGALASAREQESASAADAAATHDARAKRLGAEVGALRADVDGLWAAVRRADAATLTLSRDRAAASESLSALADSTARVQDEVDALKATQRALLAPQPPPMRMPPAQHAYQQLGFGMSESLTTPRPMLAPGAGAPRALREPWVDVRARDASHEEWRSQTPGPAKASAAEPDSQPFAAVQRAATEALARASARSPARDGGVSARAGGWADHSAGYEAESEPMSTRLTSLYRSFA